MGRIVSPETRRRLSKSLTGKIFSEEHRRNLSIVNTGKTLSVETRKKISKNHARLTGPSNSSWKGGVKALGLTTYDTQRDKLKPYEEIRKQDGTEMLEVRCAYCNRWFAPTYKAVRGRLDSINNLNKGEQRFYCSENCKIACPTYGRIKYPKGFKHTTSREVLPALRQMVFERDNWTCQICGKTTKEAQLHCHHMDPVGQNPMFQNDMDSCITLCKGCHKMVHSRRGCRYVDLQCKEKAVAQHTVKGYGVS
jgi:5-methylcytosine-specific restriction endonuclease McrA